MRTLRVSIAGTVILGLLAGSSVAVMAEDEEPAPVTYVTGTVVEQYNHEEQVGEQVTEVDEDGPRFVRGFEVFRPDMSGGGDILEQHVDWSDPRLPTKHWVLLDYAAIFTEEPAGAMNVVTSHLLEDADGSWRGTGRAVEDADDRFSQYVLTGEGAYEGLYALLRGAPGMDAHGPWDHSYEGYIFEGTLPPLRDPVEPVATQGMQTFPYPTEPPGE